jgi:hypothetical protein
VKITDIKVSFNLNNLVESFCKNVASGPKHVINFQKVMVKKNEMNQELKMKGRKLNLRFKDFAQKKNLLESNSIGRSNDEKVNKSCNLKVKIDCEYSNHIGEINANDYSTNSQVVHPKNSKLPTSLLQLNQRRVQKH